MRWKRIGMTRANAAILMPLVVWLRRNPLEDDALPASAVEIDVLESRKLHCLLLLISWQ